jgi:hypothetical protein
MVLIFGAILASDRCMVMAALRMMGLGVDPNYGKYDVALNRECWSPRVVSLILLG